MLLLNSSHYTIWNPKPKKKEKPIKPVISKDPVIDETPIKLNEDPRYKDFINAQWDEMNK